MDVTNKVLAYKSYLAQAKEAVKEEDFLRAKDLYVEACKYANEISLEADSYEVKMEYYNFAKEILAYIRSDFGRKKVKTSNNNSSSDNDDTEFQPENTSEENKVTFNDVAGLQDVKDEIIYNVIEPLQNPELAKQYGIKPGAKVLLYGPPGTGKTYIARAIAGEIDAAFYQINCQDLISKYMGDSSKKIDALFKQAQKNKRVIIFFDEIDSMASKREGDGGSVDGEMARFVASFLTKVDGFKKPESCEMMLLIAATNRPWALDEAMLRGGRFDTHIYVGLPDYDARLFLVNKTFNVVVNKEFDALNLAKRLEGFGGGDIVSLCNKMINLAYRRAIKTKNNEPVTEDDVNKVLSSAVKTFSNEDYERFMAFKNGEDF